MSKYLSHLMWLYLTIDVSLSERVFIEKHIGNIREAVYSETPSKIHRAKSYKSTEYILPPIPKIRLGPACVYNAECPECLKPLTQRCIANRCQCIYMRNLFTSILNATIKNEIYNRFDCIQRWDSNPKLIYFDQSRDFCIKEYPIKAEFSDCRNSHIITSMADGLEYCMDAVSSIHMLCTENLHCQVAVNTNDMIGICVSGICQLKSVISITDYVKHNPFCDNNYLTYCREIDYKYTKLSHKRYVECSRLCFLLYDHGGVPATYSQQCLCFKRSETPPTRYIKRS